MYAVGTVLRVAHGLLGDIGLYLPKLQIVAGVEHTAVGVAASAHKVVAGLLGGGNEHTGAVEVLGEKGLGYLRAEVAKVHHQGVAAVFLNVFKSLYHVYFRLHYADRALVDAGRFCTVFGVKGFHQGPSAVH